MQRSVRVKASEFDRFEFLMGAFLNDVTVLEEACLSFTVMQSPTDKLAFTFHEEYAGAAAWDAHQSTSHKLRWWPHIMQTVESMTCSRFELEDRTPGN
ncbi:MAG: putative quinol monooxygenase [Hyphomicrobiaceae bacterium]